MPNSYIEATNLCRAIHGEDPFYVVEMGRNPDTGQMYPARHYQTTITDLPRELTKAESLGREPFVMAGVGDGDGFKAENVVKTWVIALDFDQRAPDTIKKNHHLKPSFVVATSPQRSHAGWILTEPISPDEAKVIARAMSARLGADMAFAKPNQLIRLPGFKNGKYENVTTRLWNGFDLYSQLSLDYLCKAFDVGVVSACNAWVAQHYEDYRAGRVNAQTAADALVAAGYLQAYADDYLSWITMLFSFAALGQAGKAAAEKFSALSRKFSPDEFEKKWNQICESDGYGHIGTVFSAAMKAGWENPGWRHECGKMDSQFITDRDVARRVAAELWPEVIAYAPASDKKPSYIFHSWNDGVYDPLSDTQRRNIIEDSIRQIGKEADNPAAQNFLKQKIGRNRELDEFCEHIGEVSNQWTHAHCLASYPYFAVKNGVLNLLTGELVPSEFRPFSPMKGKVVFDPEAKADLFMKVLFDIFEGDEEMVHFLIRLFGLVMLGTPKHHLFVVLYGPDGRNGKSVIVESMRFIFGNYAYTLGATSIMTKSHVSDGATPALAMLPGKRLVIINEPNRKYEYDSGLIKLMTGGEVVTARALYGQVIEFTPEFTPVLVTNYLPRCSDGDNALWRRMMIIPFNRSFTDDEIDKDLKEKLRNESSGILNILLDGVRDYLENGLRIPEKVKKFGQSERKAMDPCEAWFEDCAELNSIPGTETELKALWASYQSWAQSAAGFRVLTKREFSKMLEKRGHSKVIRRNNPSFVGISLRCDQ